MKQPGFDRMNGKRISIPDHPLWDDAYKLSISIAIEKLAGIKDIEVQCRNSGTDCRVIDSQKAVLVRYLYRDYFITLPDARVSLSGSAEEVPVRERILILHYFITAKGTPPANRAITFRELPEGNTYYPTFLKRTIKSLLDRFAAEPSLLVRAAEKLGGRRVDYGDAAATIDAFSRVPVTIVLWRGDEEFAPQGNILFDASITDYLPTEDITVLCEIITWKLIRLPK